MGNVLRVSSTRICEDASSIEELGKNFASLVSELQSAEDKLASCWEGDAMNAYRITIDEFITILNEVNANLKLYSDALRDCSNKYRHAEQDVSSKIKSIIV